MILTQRRKFNVTSRVSREKLLEGSFLLIDLQSLLMAQTMHLTQRGNSFITGVN